MADPFAGVRGPRREMHRSDLARHTFRGELEYLAATITRSKIRGFRIELGEIESALNPASGYSRKCGAWWLTGLAVTERLGGRGRGSQLPPPMRQNCARNWAGRSPITWSHRSSLP